MTPAGHPRRVPHEDRVEYAKPPIVEALCQFNFAPQLAWSPITPGMFYERIRAEYPTSPEAQQQVQANVQFPNDAAGQASLTLGQGDQRLLYRDQARQRLVVLSASTISVNSLPPYEGWPQLSQRFERLLTKTKDILREVRVSSVSVRYINRILVPMSEPTPVSDFFDIPYRIVGGKPTGVSTLFQRVETQLPDHTAGLFTFASVELTEGEQGGQPFLLDLEFRRLFETPIDFEEALSAAEELKRLENSEFESCITDRARRLFE